MFHGENTFVHKNDSTNLLTFVCDKCSITKHNLFKMKEETKTFQMMCHSLCRSVCVDCSGMGHFHSAYSTGKIIHKKLHM